MKNIDSVGKTLRIGIDARMYGLKHAGIGRYIQNLVEELLKIDRENEYVLFVRKDFLKNINSNIKYQTSHPEGIPRREHIKYVTAEARHYSLKEQFLLPYLISKEKIDLMHFPHFNVPIFYSGNYVVTIHDLIKHSSRGGMTTTRNPLFYWLKYLGYLIVFWLAVKRAKKILVPSKTVAIQLRKVYGIDEEKVVVTYEGVDSKLKGNKRDKGIKSIKGEVILEKYGIRKPFLLYVGSVYPHKNISNLIKSVKILNQLLAANHQLSITLVIVCGRDVFWERLVKEIKKLNAEKLVNLIGFVSDENLLVLYNEAEAFVFPSEAEGFGLPGLEAMASGLPVLASDIPVFREIYRNAALYFDFQNPEDIAEKIKMVIKDGELRDKMRSAGFKICSEFSWPKMADETLKTYRQTIALSKNNF